MVPATGSEKSSEVPQLSGTVYGEVRSGCLYMRWGVIIGA